MRVSARSLVVLLAMVVSLALAAPMFARGDSASITLATAAKVGSITLPAGDYHLLVKDNSIAFEQHGKVVAEASGQWKKSSAREYQDSVVRDGDGRVLEIHLQGRDSYFVVG
jgi:hypothetical protein